MNQSLFLDGLKIMKNKPVAWINVEKRRLEWDKPTLWETPTVVKLDRIPLYIHPAKTLTDEEILGAWKENSSSGELYYDLLDFARAILRKAQGK